ncbi:hypothetical protein A2U01_0062887, partial [Trifolium medium]|nr:hypothetical protein [Trifolium medium]
TRSSAHLKTLSTCHNILLCCSLVTVTITGVVPSSTPPPPPTAVGFGNRASINRNSVSREPETTSDPTRRVTCPSGSGPSICSLRVPLEGMNSNETDF